MLNVDARLLTLVDVAEVLNTSRSQVYALVRRKHLAAARIGGRGQWRVSRQDLQAYLDKTYGETSDWIDNRPYGCLVTESLGRRTADADLLRAQPSPAVVGSLCWGAGSALAVPLSDGGECGEGGVVGFGEGVEVFLGGDDAAVSEAFFDGLQVGAAGEQPGGVGVAQVVGADADADAGGVEGGFPDVFAEPGAGDVPVGGEGAAAGGAGAGCWSLPAARRSAR